MAISRYAIKTATVTFGQKSFEMDTGFAMKAESKEAVEVTSLGDTVKRFIPGALKEIDEFTLPLFQKGKDDITVDDAPASLTIDATLENGETQDVSVTVSYAKVIVTKVAPANVQASSDRKATYDVTFRPDGSESAK